MNSFPPSSAVSTADSVCVTPMAAQALVVLAERDAWLLERAEFPGERRLRANVEAGSDHRLNVQLWIRFRSGGAPLQTAIDFRHTATAGCALQFRPVTGSAHGELSWVCAGAALLA